jgi:predicted AlkP superfamily phosphohydrolase/phosphomutase
MASSKDPGTLGIYGFRNRADHTYDKLSIATSLAVREPRLWDILGQRDKSSIVIGVPGTFPIVRPVNGCMITSFLTPGVDSDYTWPKNLKHEIAELVGEYMVDVRGFRTDDKQWLLDQIYEMTDKRFKVAKHLLTSRPWDLFWMVEMGTDRIHHGFWQYFDETHHRYEPGNPFENAIRDYYIHTDKLIGELLDAMDLDKTAVWIVSDHGAKCMVGGLCFNDWLIREGYLHLKQPVTEPTRFDIKRVDWSKTRAWGEGGYYGRCFLNVKDREPEGIVEPAEVEALRDEISAKLTALPDHEGQPMGTHVHKPEEIYKQVNRVPPDLIVIFGDLRWRSVGTVGNPDIYTFENDTGPDDANHAQQGMYAFSHPSIPTGGRQDDATLYDVAPTVLNMLGQPIPQDMRGRSLIA